MRLKNWILLAQDRYLKTGDQDALVQVYEGLKAIGLTIQANEKEDQINKDPETVMDIVGNVILRLMKKQEPVIKTAPSAYMKTALFYQNKSLFHDSIEDHEDVSSDEPPDVTYEEYTDGLMNGVEISPETEEGQLVRATLDAQLDWHLVHKCLSDKTFRVEYRKKMNEVKRYAKNHLQSNRMLQTGGSHNRAQVLSGTSELGESRTGKAEELLCDS